MMDRYMRCDPECADQLAAAGMKYEGRRQQQRGDGEGGGGKGGEGEGEGATNYLPASPHHRKIIIYHSNLCICLQRSQNQYILYCTYSYSSMHVHPY
jgi:hypothetical protein